LPIIQSIFKSPLSFFAIERTTHIPLSGLFLSYRRFTGNDLIYNEKELKKRETKLIAELK